MKLDAKQRLQATPWGFLTAMPQIVPEELPTHWFESFDQLRPDHKITEYSGHEVWGYVHPGYPKTRFFVCLDSHSRPVYINEVVRVDVTTENTPIKRALSGLTLWSQAAVSFSKDADRAKLKGLATKIFWDYLATGNNAAITDGQQTPAGATFWKKLLTAAHYMAVVIDDSYTSNYVHIVGGSDRFVDASHLKYDVSQSWKESHDGIYLRVIVKR